MRYWHRSPLRGGLYHVGLLIVVCVSFNIGFFRLTGINLGDRLFAGINLPVLWTALATCIAAVVVLWNNWID